jgi:hypothetical protein
MMLTTDRRRGLHSRNLREISTSIEKGRPLNGSPSLVPAAVSSPRRLLPSLIAILLLGVLNCALPGQRSALVREDNLGAVLDRCAQAVKAMHFEVKAVDRSHQILLAEGRVEGNLNFHDVRLSIKVVHVVGKTYRVEAIATADERGIRAGAERKAREFFFRELRQTGIIIEK